MFVIRLVGLSCDWYVTTYSRSVGDLLGSTRKSEAKLFASYWDVSRWAERYASSHNYDLVELV